MAQELAWNATALRYEGITSEGTALCIDGETHAAAVLDWLRETYGFRTLASEYSDPEYQQARLGVDDPAHWSDLIDEPGSGVYAIPRAPSTI